MNGTLLDTGIIVACLDRSETHHSDCVAIIHDTPGTLVTCEAVIAESCYLLRNMPGATEAILENVEKGVFQIPFSLVNRAGQVARLMKKYADIPMDLADACMVDLATQMGQGRIITLDSDFRFYRWSRNRQFELLLQLS